MQVLNLHLWCVIKHFPQQEFSSLITVPSLFTVYFFFFLGITYLWKFAYPTDFFSVQQLFFVISLWPVSAKPGAVSNTIPPGLQLPMAAIAKLCVISVLACSESTMALSKDNISTSQHYKKNSAGLPKLMNLCKMCFCRYLFLKGWAVY